MSGPRSRWQLLPVRVQFVHRGVAIPYVLENLPLASFVRRGPLKIPVRSHATTNSTGNKIITLLRYQPPPLSKPKRKRTKRCSNLSFQRRQLYGFLYIIPLSPLPPLSRPVEILRKTRAVNSKHTATHAGSRWEHAARIDHPDRMAGLMDPRTCRDFEELTAAF